MADEVKLVDGKFVKTGKAAKVTGQKPPKYPYDLTQYSELLKVAKSDGIDAGETKAKNTAAVNTMTGLILDAFIHDRAKPSK